MAPRKFQVGKHVFLLNSKLKLFPRKLRSHWSSPFQITQNFPFGAMELMEEKSKRTFKVNGQCIKHYWGGNFDYQQTHIPLNEA